MKEKRYAGKFSNMKSQESGADRMVIKEYSIDGLDIIGSNHGNGNFKTAHSIFKTSVEVSGKAPAYSKDYVEYNGV